MSAMCFWVLSLPLFPSQDGPMHRYYVHALDTILQHKPGYALYQIRHPFPPYATHYLLLLGLSHLFPFDWAEKIFICLTMALFALGLRLTAKAVGAAGEWTSLFVAPLLLSWSMMMGFFNYVMGISLVLLAVALWQRSRNGHRWSLPLYLLVVAVLTFTHPIPLLLLIFIAAIDIVVSCSIQQHGIQIKTWLSRERYRALALALTVLAMGFPALAIDHSKADTAKTIADTRFHADYLRTALLLTGMSPYNSRTHDLWLNAYRVFLYAMLLVALWVGGREFLSAIRDRRPSIATTLFLSIVILLVALPILPNEVNGSFYFSTRLIMVLWPAALIAAGAAALPRGKLQSWLIAVSLVGTVLTLGSAQKFMRPVAAQLKTIETVMLPDHERGLVLLGDGLPDYMRFEKQLGFDPYQWGAILPVTRHDDIILDSPWMDQKIAPLAPAPGGPILLPDVAITRISRTNPPLVKGRSLPGAYEAKMVNQASFLLLAAAPDEIAQGISTQLSLAESAKYSCHQVQAWYLVCLSKSLSLGTK
jgi:hypothetical protein